MITLKSRIKAGKLSDIPVRFLLHNHNSLFFNFSQSKYQGGFIFCWYDLWEIPKLKLLLLKEKSWKRNIFECRMLKVINIKIVTFSFIGGRQLKCSFKFFPLKFVIRLGDKYQLKHFVLLQKNMKISKQRKCTMSWFQNLLHLPLFSAWATEANWLI